MKGYKAEIKAWEFCGGRWNWTIGFMLRGQAYGDDARLTSGWYKGYKSASLARRAAKRWAKKLGIEL